MLLDRDLKLYRIIQSSFAVFDQIFMLSAEILSLSFFLATSKDWKIHYSALNRLIISLNIIFQNPTLNVT